MPPKSDCETIFSNQQSILKRRVGSTWSLLFFLMFYSSLVIFKKKKKHIQIEVVNPVNPERHILVVIYLKNKSVNGKSIQNDE